MKKRIISLILCVFATAFAFACGDGENGLGEPKNVPDYSAYANEKFEPYAYAAASDGTHVVVQADGSSLRLNPTGKSFLTEEYYKDYLDCGFTIFMPQDRAQMRAGMSDSEKAEAQKVVEDAYDAGVTKTLIQDARIQNLSATEGGLIGAGKAYADEAALDAYVKSVMSDYWDWKGFYGVLLRDEPKYNVAVAYGQTYKSIKRVAAAEGREIFVQYNLYPMSKGCTLSGVYPVVGQYNSTSDPSLVAGEATLATSDDDVTDEELFVRYKAYIDLFLDETGADYLQFDSYPIKATYVSEYYIPNLQIAAQTVAERDISLNLVTNSTHMTLKNNPVYSPLEEAGLRWQNNTLLSYGVKQINYFTYFTKYYNVVGGEMYFDGGSFVTWSGEKTDIYYKAKQIMAENNALAPYIKQFKYSTSKGYAVEPGAFDSMNQIRYMLEEKDFTVLKSVELNRECALVTELYDADKELYMYCFTNVTAPYHKGARTYETLTMTFDKEYNYAIVFTDGEKEVVTLQNNSLTLKASPGFGHYVIPFTGK